MSSLSTIWENTDGCAEQYRCASELYLVSVLSQLHSIIFNRGISATGSGKKVVDVLHDVDKRYIYQFMSKVKFLGQSDFISRLKCTLALKTKM